MHGLIIALLILILLILVYRCNGQLLPNMHSAAPEQFTIGDIRGSVATFSNTLQRRMGMGGAGENYSTKSRTGTFDAHGGQYEGFSAPVAKNTMWDGYYKPSLLPL